MAPTDNIADGYANESALHGRCRRSIRSNMVTARFCGGVNAVRPRVDQVLTTPKTRKATLAAFVIII